MGTRNTALLEKILDVLGPIADKADALSRLEAHFQHRLLVDAGNTSDVAAYAERLRLRVTSEECSAVLDYIGHQEIVKITIDAVEEAINEHFGWDRFIEP